MTLILNPQILFQTGVLLAQASGDLGKLQDGLGVVGAILMAIGSIWGILVMWGGIRQKQSGTPGGTESIIEGLMIPAATIIIGALFAAFDLGDFAIKPKW